MTYQKSIFTGLVGVSLLVLGACTSANSATTAAEDATVVAKADQATTVYLKPGAGIQFSHNYDGKTNPGEIENFQVFVKGGSLNGAVSIKMENNEGLQIYNNIANQKFNVVQKDAKGLDETMDVSVGAQNPGRYYLKFVATADQGGDNPMMRAFAIPIQVGDQPYVPKLGKGMTVQETPSGEKIISMEASESGGN